MSIYRSTPIPRFPALVGPRVFNSTLIASVFDYEVEGAKESIVPMIEFLWGRKLTTQEIYDIAQNDALREELDRQLPNLPIGGWHPSRSSSWEAWFEQVGDKVALCPSALPKTPTTCEEAAELLDVDIENTPNYRYIALERGSQMCFFELRPSGRINAFVSPQVQAWCDYTRGVIANDALVLLGARRRK